MGEGGVDWDAIGLSANPIAGVLKVFGGDASFKVVDYIKIRN